MNNTRNQSDLPMSRLKLL